MTYGSASLFLMVNEAARCLEEKVVATPEDADYGMILGTGFPILPRRPVAFCRKFWNRKGGDRNGGTSVQRRREICAVRFAASACAERHKFYEDVN